jgi:hypothetical protein
MAELLPSTLSCVSFDAILLPNGKRLKTLERAQRRIAISSRIREVPATSISRWAFIHPVEAVISEQSFN